MPVKKLAKDKKSKPKTVSKEPKGQPDKKRK
jgi:hypothetical protein